MLGAAAWESLRSTARRPFESLPSRIIVSVFAAALVTSGLVTWISTESTETFLRSRIDERFPAVLEQARQRVETWYEQRRLEIETFARSETVVRSLADGAHPERRAEARKYLAYVREGVPHYRSLFTLGASGTPHVWVGDEVGLARSLRDRLAAIAAPRVGSLQRAEGAEKAAFQIISAPVLHGTERLGSLHAIVPLRPMQDILRSQDLTETARLLLVGPAGQILADSSGSVDDALFERPLPEPGAEPIVTDYLDAGGRHVVGSSIPLEALGWTLVMEESYDRAFAPVVSVLHKILAINVGIVMVFGVIAFLIARSIVRPIRALSEGAQRIALGDTDVPIPSSRAQDEIGVLSRALNAMISELERRKDEIERTNAELTRANEGLRRNNELLEQLSFTDGLTRLPNHRYFQDRLRLETRRSDRSRDPLSLLLIDIDDFKSLNDHYGHAEGDEVLRRVAHTINNSVRETDLPARYGGEEFAVIGARTDAAGALALAEKLRQAVASARFRARESESTDLRVTISIGVSVYDGDLKTLFNDADRALYRAKASGKDCVVMAGEGERMPGEAKGGASGARSRG
jgi:diguanylate cyclase (GGDEF)-like protein